ncbi:MAG: LpxA family transferase [Rhodoferax sp.]|nr:LpxA family transferase [Rhodoferax sp.]
MLMPNPIVRLQDFVDSIEDSALAPWADHLPWELTSNSEAIVRELIAFLVVEDFAVTGDIAVHRTATVEAGAILKGPLILGADCFVAAGAYLRGGNWVDQRCIFGPGAELKSSFVFAGTKLAHFNFVGDSILGADVNLEAGSIVCNYRNERSDKEIWVRVGNDLQRTGQTKFGAVIGDHARVGANAVIAPGGLLTPGSVLRRTTLWDADD